MYKVIKLFLLFVLTATSSYASKIVSVGGSITETIVALGHGDELIGVDLSSAYPKELTSKLPNVGYWLNLPQEGILSLKPEIVIVSSQAGPKKLIDSLPKYGIKTYVIEDEPTIQGAKTKIKQIAEILGEEEKASEIIARIEHNVSKINKEIKGKKKPKVLFLFSREQGSFMAAGRETKAGYMISIAGGENVVDFKQYTQISLEAILKLNPDVIITSDHISKTGLDKNIISSTNAAKNKQIYTMGMLLISGFNVRVDTALQELSCMFNNNKLSYCNK